MFQNNTQTAMPSNMRIAIAGTCGLALLIAQEINNTTSHQLVILSRTVCVQRHHFAVRCWTKLTFC